MKRIAIIFLLLVTNTVISFAQAPDFILEGRISLDRIPTPQINTEAIGKVCIKIQVNSNGEVVYTDIDEVESNIVDPDIRKASEIAARKARFSHASGRRLQDGYIFYYFNGQTYAETPITEQVTNTPDLSALDLYLSPDTPKDGIRPNMRYKELKQIYYHRSYIPALSDRYNPKLNGLASFFLPGLGQMLSRQNNRGIGQMSIAVVLGTLSGITGYIGYTYGNDAFVITSLCSSLALLGLQISSCVDANRVSKIMNMYERDLKKQNIIRFNLHPSLEVMNSVMGTSAVAGLGLSMTF